MTDDTTPLAEQPLSYYLNNDVDVPFTIKSLKQHGFITKVLDRNAYVSFSVMPWHYSNLEFWRPAAPFLIGYNFFGKLNTQNETGLFIYAKHSNHFNVPPLKIDEPYSAILINRTKQRLVVELGYHYAWKYGSVVAYIHRDNYKNDEDYNKIKLGEVLDVFYWGEALNGIRICGSNDYNKFWLSREASTLVGKTIAIKAHRTSVTKQLFFTYNDEHKVIIHHSPEYYLEPTYEQLSISLEQLQGNETLNVKVVNIDKYKKCIFGMWIPKDTIKKERKHKPPTTNNHRTYLIHDHRKSLTHNNDKLRFFLSGHSPKGFTTNIFNKTTLVSYKDMPIQYHNLQQWEAVYPFLRDVVFEASPYLSTTYNNLLKIDIKGIYPKHTLAPLRVHREYKAIVIDTTHDGYTIELGHNFSWLYGSIHTSIITLEHYNIGSEISVTITQRTYKGHIKCMTVQQKETFDSYTKELVVGNIIAITAHVEPQDSSISFSYRDRITAHMHLKENDYKKGLFTSIKILYKQIKNKDVIFAKIAAINKYQGCVYVLWSFDKNANNMILQEADSPASLSTGTPHNTHITKEASNNKDEELDKHFLSPEILNNRKYIGTQQHIDIQRRTKEDFPHFSFNNIPIRLELYRNKQRLKTQQQNRIIILLHQSDTLIGHIKGAGKNYLIAHCNISDKDISDIFLR